MARIHLTSGLCPICGTTVARTRTAHRGPNGSMHGSEAYHCPVHGRRTASPSGLTVTEWAAPTMPLLGEIMGVPVVA